MSELPNLFYIYLASGIFFLLIEMLTATFYGLSMSVACFILAVYVYATGDTSMTAIQGGLLAVTSAVFAYFLPKWMMSHAKVLKSGLDLHIGHSFRLEQVGTDWKIKIDGVDYLIGEESVTDEFAPGKKVMLEGHDGGILKVTIMK